MALSQGQMRAVGAVLAIVLIGGAVGIVVYQMKKPGKVLVVEAGTAAPVQRPGVVATAKGKPVSGMIVSSDGKPVAQAEVVNEVIAKQVSKQLNGFTDFLREQSVIGIGIGLVLGTQLKSVVDSITNGFVLPLTQLVLPNQKSLADQTFMVHVTHHRAIAIQWGSIVYAVFNFLVVAFIVYMVFKLLKLDRLAKKK